MKLTYVLALGFLAACGDPNSYLLVEGRAGKQGTSCTVAEVTEGALITCEDGTSQLVKNGSDGSTGAVGQTGSTGLAGNNGTDGSNCSVLQVASGDAVLPLGGAVISCSNGTSALVSNGAQGSTGSQGSAGSNGTNGLDATPVTTVDPCGHQSSQDEVFLRLPDGKLVASFSDSTSGSMTRLSFLNPGSNYMSTDNTHCYFDVSATYQLQNEHN